MQSVRKVLFAFLGTLLVTTGSLAKEPLRTQDSIIIENGSVPETGIIADADGKVFLEFAKETRGVNQSDRTSFQGEILPPSIIPLTGKKPRPRMQEVLTFELLSDTANKILFADKFDLVSTRTILRLQQTDPDNFQRTASVKVLIPLHEKFNILGLWEYRGEKEGWLRLGGQAKPSSDPDIMVFSSSIKSTGIFTLFDEDPPPSYIPPFPIDQIEFVDTIPPEFVDTGVQNDNIIPENEVGVVPDYIFPEQQIPNVIPPITVEGEIPAITPVQTPQGGIPPVTVDDSQEPDVLVENPVEEVIVPTDSKLPQTGPADGEESTSQGFPLGIIFALFIVGLSAFFAFRKKKYS